MSKTPPKDSSEVKSSRSKSSPKKTKSTAGADDKLDAKESSVAKPEGEKSPGAKKQKSSAGIKQKKSTAGGGKDGAESESRDQSKDKDPSTDKGGAEKEKKSKEDKGKKSTADIKSANDAKKSAIDVKKSATDVKSKKKGSVTDADKDKKDADGGASPKKKKSKDDAAAEKKDAAAADGGAPQKKKKSTIDGEKDASKSDGGASLKKKKSKDDTAAEKKEAAAAADGGASQKKKKSTTDVEKKDAGGVDSAAAPKKKKSTTDAEKKEATTADDGASPKKKKSNADGKAAAAEKTADEKGAAAEAKESKKPVADAESEKPAALAKMAAATDKAAEPAKAVAPVAAPAPAAAAAAPAQPAPDPAPEVKTEPPKPKPAAASDKERDRPVEEEQPPKKDRLEEKRSATRSTADLSASHKAAGEKWRLRLIGSGCAHVQRPGDDNVVAVRFTLNGSGAQLDGTPILINEHPKRMSLELPRLRASVELLMPPLHTSTAVQIGWVHLTTINRYVQTYSGDNVCVVTVPPQTNVGDNWNPPWAHRGYSGRGPVTFMGPTSETQVHQISTVYEEPAHQVAWTARESAQLKEVERDQTFHLWLAAKNLNGGSLYVLKRYVWRWNYRIKVDCSKRLGSRAALVSGEMQEQPNFYPLSEEGEPKSVDAFSFAGPFYLASLRYKLTTK